MIELQPYRPVITNSNQFNISNKKTIENNFFIPDGLLISAFNFLDYTDHPAIALCCRNWRCLTQQIDFYVEIFKRAKIQPNGKPLSSYLAEDEAGILFETAQELYYTNSTNYLYIDSLLERFLNSPHPIKIDILHHAILIRAVLKDYAKTPVSYRIIFDQLNSIIANQQALDLNRAFAQYYIAIMKYSHHIDFITYEQAFDYLNAIIVHPEVFENIRADAQFHQAMLVYNYTNNLTDDEAFDLYSNVAANIEADEDIRFQSQYFQCQLKFFNRTTRISDDEAFDLFNELTHNPKVLDNNQIYIKCYQAEMQVDNRLTRINDNDALILLEDIIHNPLVDVNSHAKAQFLKIRLVYENRIDTMTKGEALGMLWDITENEAIYIEIRKEVRDFRLSLTQIQWIPIDQSILSGISFNYR